MTEATLRSVPVKTTAPLRRASAPASPLPPPPATPRLPWLAWAALLLIVAAGAALRFYKLDQPALWGDEVATWGRVTGTFGQLMDRLSKEGFVPGHYTIYWLLARFVPLDPWHMRLIPALAGALMAPAGYFLARQMFGRGTSLVAALLFATSAFGMTYARDAKMYMHTWLFVTLSVACLMHWLRTKRAWSLWGWILAGAIASTLHATSLIVLAIQPIMLLAHGGKKRWRDPPYFVVGIALILAFPAWYYGYYNHYIARTGIAPVTTAASESINESQVRWRNSGITWVSEFNQGIGPWELTLNSATSYLVGLQWPRDAMDPRGFKKDGVPEWFLPLCVAVMSPLILLLIAGALPWRARGALGAAARGDDRRQPWWISATWLGLWLIVPTYGVYYCRSFAPFSPPWEPLAIAHEAIGGRWYLLVPLGVAAALALGRYPRLAGWAAWGVAVWLGMSMGVAVWQRGSYWLHGWGDLLADGRMLWPIATVAPAVVWHYAGATPRQRLAKTGLLLAATAIVFAACLGAYALMSVAHARHAAKGLEWHSIWMPRYLGIVYPALVVAAAALLMRLPTWPLRTAAIAVLVAVNLTQGLARIELDTEPPFQQLAEDLWDTYTTQHATTVAINLRDHGGHRRDWSKGWIQDYYVYAVSGWNADNVIGKRVSPRHVLRYRVDVEMDQVRRGLQNRPQLSRIIVWERFDALATPPDADPLLEQFGDQIERASERVYRTHQLWTWRPGDVYRRREYLRKASDQEGPAI